MTTRVSILALLAVCLAGCGSDNPTGPNLPSNGTMSARIDGVEWSATVITPAMTSGIVAAIGGSDANARTIGFGWLDNGPGTYTIGSSVGLNGNLSTADGLWVANSTAGSGTLVISTRTNGRVTGTFQFNLSPSGAATGTRTITNGAFDITF